MAIIDLKKATLFGVAAESEFVLEDLQRLGCLHLVDLANADDDAQNLPGRTQTDAYKALQYLLQARGNRRQVKDASFFEAATVTREALTLKDRIEDLTQKLDFLKVRIAALKPWGYFYFPPVEELRGLRLWFYQVPRYQMRRMPPIEEVAWEVVAEDSRHIYVVALAEDEPTGMPVGRTHTGSQPLGELEAEAENIVIELEDLADRRLGLTRWCYLLAATLARVEDTEQRRAAADHAYNDGQVFAVRGWVGEDALDELHRFADSRSLALMIEDIEDDDNPPTLLRNPEVFAGGEEVVKFYSMPGYREVDPSVPLYLSFVPFFAMIMSDAGYAAVLGLVVAMSWGKLASSRAGHRVATMARSIVVASVAWGVLVGSYFGISPPPESLLGRLAIIDMNNFDLMMTIALAVGLSHVAIANALTAWRRYPHPRALAPVGWISVLAGGAAIVAAWTGWAAALETLGWPLMIAGFALIVLFSSARPFPAKTSMGWVWRTIDGIMALAGLSSAFGDVLSYLRLFALGLASASLAITFNNLAAEAAANLPGLGILIALLTLVVGHAINFALAIMSGVVHGLRLNVIEFFNWSVGEEGFAFRPFSKKEVEPWNPSSSA